MLQCFCRNNCVCETFKEVGMLQLIRITQNGQSCMILNS